MSSWCTIPWLRRDVHYTVRLVIEELVHCTQPGHPFPEGLSTNTEPALDVSVDSACRRLQKLLLRLAPARWQRGMGWAVSYTHMPVAANSEV